MLTLTESNITCQRTKTIGSFLNRRAEHRRNVVSDKILRIINSSSPLENEVTEK